VSYDPHNTSEIPIGMPVRGYSGDLLGYVREVHSHYLLVGQEGKHDDLDVPVHSIKGVSIGDLHVSVYRVAVSEVDDVESAHRMGEE
jgi:hypothetical protein